MSPVVRVASRILVLDRSDRVLLVGARLIDLDTPPAEVLWWYTPGGGVDPGEFRYGTLQSANSPRRSGCL